MKELQDIVQAFDQADRTGKPTALATVVHVEGSSYRRAEARMLITDDVHILIEPIYNTKQDNLIHFLILHKPCNNLL